MLDNILNRLYLFLLMIALAFASKAQQPHFIYLQTDNGQPFYVKLNNKITSSSAEGYVILSGLTEGDYNLVIGFPKNQFPEEKFDVAINKDNMGFLLKDFDEKGWQLFNLQTLALIEGTTNKTLVTNKPDNKSADAFTKMLAGVVKDSSILINHQPVVPFEKKPEVLSDTLATNATALSSSVKDTTSQSTVEKPIEKTNAEITKILSKVDKEGVQMVYQDKGDSAIDTVRIFFPSIENPAKSDSDKLIASVNNNINLSPNQDNPVQNKNEGSIPDSAKSVVKSSGRVEEDSSKPDSTEFLPFSITAKKVNDSIKTSAINSETTSESSSKQVSSSSIVDTSANTNDTTKVIVKNSVLDLGSSSRSDSTSSIKIIPPIAQDTGKSVTKISGINSDGLPGVDTTVTSMEAVNNEKGISSPGSLRKVTDSSFQVKQNAQLSEKIDSVASAEKVAVPEIPEVKDTVSQSASQSSEGTEKEKVQPQSEKESFIVPKALTSSKVNSDCKDFATNQDFFKLRKKMAAETNMEGMIKVAMKYFKTKCFSTEQIRDLSYLFLTNEGKYRFFDAAYPFTSDSNLFETLGSQFSDSYYLNRFKAMILK